jgi:uncharacterized membrane protein
MRTALVALGIVLVALGLTVLAWQEITYTTHEKLLEIGPVTATAEREKTIELSPALGTASLLSGLGLLLLAVKR